MDSPVLQDQLDRKEIEATTAWMDFRVDQALKATLVCPAFLVCLV